MVRLGAICLVVGLGITGCASEVEAESPAPHETTSPSVPEKVGEEAPTQDAASCLEGTWLVDNEYFLIQFQELGGSDATEVSGRVTQSFGPSGEVETIYDEWRIDTVTEGIATSIVRNGTDLGTYSADDTTVTLQETEVTSKLVVSAAGIEQVHDADPVSFADVPYTCDAASASIAAPDGNANMTRIS